MFAVEDEIRGDEHEPGVRLGAQVGQKRRAASVDAPGAIGIVKAITDARQGGGVQHDIGGGIAEGGGDRIGVGEVHGGSDGGDKLRRSPAGPGDEGVFQLGQAAPR